ncbi:DUF3102 domain-containing protein [Bacillus sp. FSL R12-0069]|uniref:DUF3102 domain-containing protein n=1 Tax=Bacillus sp. FSL R12-0069 TaxID=2975342 RepID=UPI0030F6968E
MNLSTDINVITAEVKSYQQIAGQSIFEIGKRLKYVKENDLAQGQWTNWCEKQCGIKRQTANRFIQAFEQFPNGTTSYQIESAKVFELLSLPQEINRQQFIEEPHMIPSTGEEKAVNEMTVRELREVKKALKEKEKLLGQETERRKRAEQETFSARKSEELTRKQLEKLEQQEPQIIEREVLKEVPVESNEHINAINKLNDNNKKLKEELQFYQEQAESLQQENEELKQDEETAGYLPDWNVNTFCYELEEIVRACSFSSKQMSTIMAASSNVKANIYRNMTTIQNLMKELENALEHDIISV